MKVLVINSGSSSIKYQLLDMQTRAVLASGIVERIGEPLGALTHKKAPGTDAEARKTIEQPIADHKQGMNLLVGLLTDPELGAVADMGEIYAVGHRVLQGGETLYMPLAVDDAVKDAIRANIPIGPLHNPANLAGIEVAQELMPGVPQVAVFDTEFHQTMPAQAFIYPLPYEMYERHRIRRYGFHGTSHKFIAKETARLLGRAPEELNLIIAHLGNGCSLSAVKAGRCVDTSMGLTPLAGVMMGTRCGDIDPAIIPFIAEQTGMDVVQIDAMLNKQSGLKGICGMNDMRDIHAARAKGDERAQLAFEMFTYRIRKYVGAYFAALGRVDAVVFTAGIGENDPDVRAGVLQGLESLGIVLDPAANAGRAGEWMRIAAPQSRVDVLVVRTNEELEIARTTVEVLRKG
jgi:acetate kinase